MCYNPRANWQLVPGRKDTEFRTRKIQIFDVLSKSLIYKTDFSHMFSVLCYLFE